MTPKIEATDVTVRLGGRLILDRVSLTIADGDFIGIIGPNGAGKTTLLRVLLGLQSVDSGTVIRRVSGAEIGYVPQHSSFDADFPATVEDVVLTGRIGKSRWFGPYTRRDREIAAEAIERVGLSAFRAHPVARLSGGERQRTMLARALATEPEILLLDESTSNVDPAFLASFCELLDQLKTRAPVLLISHDIGVVTRLVNRIGCLNRTLHVHPTSTLTHEMLESIYPCPVDLIAHGAVPHRTLEEHRH